MKHLIIVLFALSSLQLFPQGEILKATLPGDLLGKDSAEVCRLLSENEFSNFTFQQSAAQSAPQCNTCCRDLPWIYKSESWLAVTASNKNGIKVSVCIGTTKKCLMAVFSGFSVSTPNKDKLIKPFTDAGWKNQQKIRRYKNNTHIDLLRKKKEYLTLSLIDKNLSEVSVYRIK